MHEIYVIAKAAKLLLRDAASGKMEKIGPHAWVHFGKLPAGTPEQDGADIRVRVAKTQEDVSAIEAENKQLAEAEAHQAEVRAARAKAKAAPAKPEPPKVEYRGESEQPEKPHKFGKRRG